MPYISSILLPDGTEYDIKDSNASAPTTIDATLSSSNWSSSSQTVTITGLTATSNGIIGISSTATSTQRDAARKAVLSPTAQSTNSITITADGNVPSVDIPITMIFW